MKELSNIPKKIIEECKRLGVAKFTCRFSGGSDEGFLEVDLDEVNWKDMTPDHTALVKEITTWADEAMCYSGGGDGTDYGDDYEFDLTDMTISHTEWYHQPAYNDLGTASVTIDETE